jgi:hypothetical protein
MAAFAVLCIPLCNYFMHFFAVSVHSPQNGLLKAFLLPYLKNFSASPEKKFFHVWRQKLLRWGTLLLRCVSLHFF